MTGAYRKLWRPLSWVFEVLSLPRRGYHHEAKTLRAKILSWTGISPPRNLSPKSVCAQECVRVSGKLDFLDRNFTTKAFEHFSAWASCPECGVKREKGKSGREHVSVA